MTDRRDFLRRSALYGLPLVAFGAFPASMLGAGSGVAAGSPGSPALPGGLWPSPADREPWAGIERLGEGVWAVASTPLNEHESARRTLCNGGLIAGRDAVLAIEGFASVEGAAWLAERAVELAGRRPTHVVLTHVHGDHTGGTAGYRNAAEPLEVITTDVTRRLLIERELEAQMDRGRVRGLLLPDRVLAADGAPTELDLGGRTVRLVARAGHTPSDLTVELDEPRIVFCGDLVWNDFFPNYMDAIPSKLGEHCRALLADPQATYVPGHGPLPDAPDFRDRFLGLLESVESAARRSYERGVPPDRASAEYEPDARLGEWRTFSPRYYEVAFSAWHRDLAGA